MMGRHNTGTDRARRWVITATGLFAMTMIAGAWGVGRAPRRFPVGAPAASTGSTVTVPFAVGEELTFRATFGVLPAGSARMCVEGIDTVRSRPAYHVVFTIDGGIPFFRVHDRYESWLDVETMSTLRSLQVIAEGRYRRTTAYEFYPERAEYRRNDEELRPSVGDPLDEGSFIYAVRVIGIHVGDTLRVERYFERDRNPVVLTGLRTDTVTVQAGTFATTVVRPVIKTTGIFSQNGEAEVWLTDDAHRYPVQVRTRFARFSLKLSLESLVAGGDEPRPFTPPRLGVTTREGNTSHGRERT
jgi:hypothetical protein